MAYTQAKHIQNITVRNQFRISERVNLERGVTSYFPGDRDKESTHSPFSPCTNRVGCVRCWGNFAETNRLALNGLKLWSPLTRVSSVVCGIVSHISACARVTLFRVNRAHPGNALRHHDIPKRYILTFLKRDGHVI